MSPLATSDRTSTTGQVEESSEIQTSPTNTRRRPWRDEDGYVLPTTALLLVPMMIFAAFAVDVGGWYAEAAQAQRAADSAALAAVVLMPQEPLARAAALEEAERNGYVDQPGCDTMASCVNPTSFPQVVLTPLSGDAVRVNIFTEGDNFFGKVVSEDGPVIERFSSAQYVLPVPMGNPRSALGTGNQAAAGDPTEGIWLAVNGYCTGRQQGDHISGGFLGTNYGTCGGTANPQYDAEGYYLVLDLPSGSTTETWNVEFFEPGACADDSAGRTDNEYDDDAGQTPVRIQTTLYQADLTQFDDTDNITVTNRFPVAAGANGSVTGNQLLFNADAGCNPRTWQTAFQIGPGEPRGRWLLNYRSLAVNGERDLNYFSVRLTPDSGVNAGKVCNTLGGVGVDTCPRIYARQYLPVYVLDEDTFGVDVLPVAPSGDPRASFYLAEIGEEHAGKTLEVTLFDPGEGMANLQFVDPNLDRHDFDWETIDCSVLSVCTGTTDSGGTHDSCTTVADPTTWDVEQITTTAAGTYQCLDVSGNRFQNETVQIKLDIPPNYTCDGDNCWWRIRYQSSGGDVTDRTVWSVRVIGDPVRLIE